MHPTITILFPSQQSPLFSIMKILKTLTTLSLLFRSVAGTCKCAEVCREYERIGGACWTSNEACKANGIWDLNLRRCDEVPLETFGFKLGKFCDNPDVFMNGALAPVPATSLVAVANLVEDAITAWH